MRKKPIDKCITKQEGNVGKTKFPAFIATAIVCYIFWLVLTGQIVGIFTHDARAQLLIAGGIVSIIVSLFASRFFIHKKAFHLFNPAKFFITLFYVIIIFPWELIKANVDVALRALKPSLPIKPGFVKIPVEHMSDYGLSMLANSITLTPGTITMDIVEQDGKNYYYIHWIDVQTQDPEEAGDAIKGTLEKWVRRIWK